MNEEKPEAELARRKLKAEEALAALEWFRLEGAQLLSADEFLMLEALREGFMDIASGGDLSPAPQGTQKMRLIRRVDFRYFHPEVRRTVVIDGSVSGTAEVEPHAKDAEGGV